jgi:tagatose 6-phosphate kinase
VLTVTLNPALDVTYELTQLRVGGSNRVEQVHTRPGGKGVNAARVLHSRGVSVLATGLAGGRSGEILQAVLTRLGIAHAFVPVAGETRRTVTVVERPTGAATVFTEPGPVVRRQEWNAFVARFGGLCAGVRVVVLAGSLPPGVSPEAYAQLVRRAQAAGADTIVDAAGAALRHAVTARPAVVKANAEEFVVGLGCASVDAGLTQLVDAGVALAVVTMGADGLAAATADGRLRASPPAPLQGNATGAGDACTAALAAALATGRPPEESVRDALALSAAAVAAPVAGEFDDAIFRRFRDTARVVADN